MSDIQLIDSYNRHLNYLRVSVTDRCNLNCCYCEPIKRILKLPHDDILSYEEILRLVGIGVGLGIQKVRVTGGEPLVRKGIYDFLGSLMLIKGLKDVSLTTNAVLLDENLKNIKNAGIKRINISLDTLNREKFRKITGHDRFERVWNAILRAQEEGFNPIKLNVVVLPGINDDELIDLAGLSFSFPFHIRFIEYMPIGEGPFINTSQMSGETIMDRLKSIGPLVNIKNEIIDGPAKRFRFVGAQGEIGLISAMSHHFCGQCNRLRLTADGRLRTCLLSDRFEDLKGPLRKGCADSELARIIVNAVRHKPYAHRLSTDSDAKVFDCMSSIGG
ncbi:MAG: GTP 3',8-cyclase MoaA [Desulfobacterales bacterium]